MNKLIGKAAFFPFCFMKILKIGASNLVLSESDSIHQLLVQYLLGHFSNTSLHLVDVIITK